MTAADRPSVTDNARAEAERRYPKVLTVGASSVQADHHAQMRVGFMAGAEWAAGRAETTTATDEDAARVIANYLDDYSLPANYSRPISGETHRAVAENVAPLIARELDRHGLLATARTRPTREQIAQVLYVHDNGATLYGAPMTYMDEPGRADDYLAAADAVLALYGDQPTEAEAGARALEQAADTLGTRGRMSPQALRDRAADLRGGDPR